MVPYQRQAKIVRSERLAEGIFRLTLSAPEVAAAAKPGQFVMVRPQETFDPLLRRPFSVHRVTGSGQVQILFKVIGKGTRMLSGLEPGAGLDLIGPLGNFFRPPSAGKTCLVGGGLGIAPLFFLAEELQRLRPSGDILLLLGAANAAELRPLSEDFPALGLKPELATDDGSLGRPGLVTDLMAERLDRQGAWNVFCCGPYPMMRTVAGICGENGWDCQASLETMMACGFSACLGCATPAADLHGRYKHVCKDGPVFDARELAWL